MAALFVGVRVGQGSGGELLRREVDRTEAADFLYQGGAGVLEDEALAFGEGQGGARFGRPIVQPFIGGGFVVDADAGVAEEFMIFAAFERGVEGGGSTVVD